MKKPFDRITEAYYNEMGDEFARKARERIHWICENAKGEEILDIGCSQGITSILLGREGKQVLGIDLLADSIQYANECLEKEETFTKDNVTFKNANFMNIDFDGKLYDAILLGEVLEHVTDPGRILQKATNLLKPDGHIVVTLPFGINDYFDHKKTYYLLDLLNLQTKELQIANIKSFGKWTGAVFQKNLSLEDKLNINEELVKRLEKEFYQVERSLVDENIEFNKLIKMLKEENEMYVGQREKLIYIEDEHQKQIDLKLKEINELKQMNHLQNEQMRTQKSEQEKKIAQFQKEVLRLKEELNKPKAVEVSSENNLELKKQLALKTKEKIQIQNQLMAAYKKEERLLNSYKTLRTKFENELSNLKTKYSIVLKEKIHTKEQLFEAHTKEERLLRAHNQLLRRYKALSESKLGKITLSYWQKKSGNKNRKKRG